MKTGKKILSVILVALMIITVMPFSAFAEVARSGICGDNLKWVLYDNGELVISGSGDMQDWHYDPHAISANLAPWYVNKSGIKKVFIEPGVTSIGDMAFRECSKLESISIPDSVTSIGVDAFFGCKTLSGIQIPKGVTSIGDGAFYDCYKITVLTIPDGVTSIADDVFRGCINISELTVPDGVSSIGQGAFYDCYSLKSINIPDNVTNIADYTFKNCKALPAITIPDGVTNIGREAFYGCSSLTGVTIPDSVTSIGENAFFSSAYYDNSGNWDSGVLYIGKHLIAAKTSIKEYEIRENTKTIADGAFARCKSLTSITIPDGVTTIGYRTFYYCGKLSSIIIPDGVKSIGDEAFWSCSMLTNITIPISVTSIGTSAFKDCFRIKNVYYNGNKADWNRIYIGDNNDELKKALRFVKDSDGDGLPDEWEINGADIDNDGVIDLELNKMGADPNIPDIFVEVDWMVRPNNNFLWWETQSYRNLAPSQNAMRMVYDVFKAHGINLHIDAGPNSIDFVTGKRWGNLSGGNEISYVQSFDTKNWETVVNANFSAERAAAFKHCIFADRYNGGTSSGIANGIPGQFFIVANQDWVYNGGDVSVAGTFMHELGHTLGLKHGGNDHIRYKPNYLSIMNYLYQTSGFVGTNSIDYSNYKLPDLNENNLNERNGIDPNGLTSGTGLGAKWFFKGKTYTETDIAGKSIDFNKNNKIENGVSVNLNNQSEKDLKGGYNDWDNIIFNGGTIGSADNAGIENIISFDTGNSIQEKTLEESLNTDTLANEGGAAVELVNKTLIAEKSNQKLYVDISNLTASDATYEISIECDGVVKKYSRKITVSGSTDEISFVRIEVPVVNNPAEGQYELKAVLSYPGTDDVLKTFAVKVYKPSQSEIKQMTDAIENGELDNSDIDSDIIEQIKDVLSDKFVTYMPGDVDMDGKITASDARFALRRAVNLESFAEGSPEFKACDVDNDKKVTAGDARLILRAAVGLQKL
ncbi:MAG: leucine-rich repeat protein [Oscillospiraceae bacterium]|nr:leucine-rich repeat protein [Oscillospiraceae bacterium]